MSKWVQGCVAGTRHWNDRLVLGRPYSFVNPPGAPCHEFFFNVVPEGPLSPRLAALASGAPLWLLPNANGFFTIAEVAEAPSLWCVSTGTVSPICTMCVLVVV